MFKWLLIGGAALYLAPKLLRMASENPEAVRASADAIERAREKAIELGKRGVSKGREFVASRTAKKAVSGTFAGYTGKCARCSHS